MTKIGRNEDCPCGKKKPDGKAIKYKKCCQSKDETLLSEQKEKEKKDADDRWRRKFWSHGPYTECPKCKTETFARSSVNSNTYTKQCYECGHGEKYPLPELRKKVIYLDQFVIDNFVKTLDPHHPKHEIVSRDPFWLEAYKKLDTLSKAHLVVCPDSFFHRDESGPTGYFESMQRIYEHLSGGATFYDDQNILRCQMEKHFKNYLHEKPTEFPKVDPSEIVHGDLNHWHDWMRISVNSKPGKEEVEEKMKKKEKLYKEHFLPIFETWKNEKNVKFEDRYLNETRSFVTAIIQVTAKHLARQAELHQKIQAGEQIELEDILPPPSVELIVSLSNIAKRELKIDNNEAIKKVGEYLNSGYLNVIPSMRLNSALYALIADQAANGRIRPPSQGVHVDIQMISSFLPYCDAMFIDNENADFLKDGRIKTKIGYPTKIFSRKTKKEFLDYLDSLLSSMSQEHRDLLSRVYGENYLEPYITILENK